MNLELTGTIKLIAEKEVFKNDFQKVEFVLTTNDEKYAQDIKFEVIQDNVDKFIRHNQVGDIVTVSFNVRGNEYQNKYYVNLIAWKIDKLTSNEPDQSKGLLHNNSSEGSPF